MLYIPNCRTRFIFICIRYIRYNLYFARLSARIDRFSTIELSHKTSMLYIKHRPNYQWYFYLNTLQHYLLTPWCRVLLEKLTGLQLVKKFPALYGTRKFITALTSVRHLSLSWASPIQSIYPHPTSWRSLLLLSTRLRLGLPTKTLYNPLSSLSNIMDI